MQAYVCSGVLRQNERLCTVWAPRLDLGKIKSKIKFAFLLPTILETVNYLAGK